MSDGPTTYLPSDHFYVDLISFVVLKNIFSKEKFRKNLQFGGSHLTRSALFALGNEDYQRCRQPKDIDFVFYTDENIVSEANGLTAAFLEDLQSPEHRAKYDDVIEDVTKELKDLEFEYELSLNPISGYKVDHGFRNKITMKVITLDGDVESYESYFKGPYETTKLISYISIEVSDDVLRRERRYSFSVDIGYGYSLICPPSETKIVFPGLGPDHIVLIPSASLSVMAAFKLYTAMHSYERMRAKDFYDLSIMIPHIDLQNSQLKSSLHLIFIYYTTESEEIAKLLKRKLRKPLFDDLGMLRESEGLRDEDIDSEKFVKVVSEFLDQTFI